eukprot:GHVH01016065.1.p2 GENE.GHVH01016065.1~~GHVH01016065.1.p2  ORF type:complete len:100 (-),score=12.84 GHVH01016065.1:5-304(-)
MADKVAIDKEATISQPLLSLGTIAATKIKRPRVIKEVKIPFDGLTPLSRISAVMIPKLNCHARPRSDMWAIYEKKTFNRKYKNDKKETTVKTLKSRIER